MPRKATRSSKKKKVRVSPPKSKRCGSRGKGRTAYKKSELVALAKASGVNPRQLVDDLCEQLGIQPPVDHVEIPMKRCSTLARGDDRYTREEVRLLAKYRKIKITGKTMDDLCQELGVQLHDEKITFIDEKIPDSELDTRGIQKVKEWAKTEPDTLILYYADDRMLTDQDYSMFPLVNTLLKISGVSTFMIPLNEDIEETYNRLVSKISSYKVVRILNADPQQNGMDYRLLPGQGEQIAKMFELLSQTVFK